MPLSQKFRLLVKLRNKKRVKLFSTVTPTTVNAKLDNKEYFNAKQFSQIPGPSPVPVFGNLLDYKFGSLSVERYHDAVIERYKKYGPLVRERFGNREVIHVFDPDDARTIFQSEGKVPYIVPLQETALMYRQMRQLSLGLGNMNGDEWYRLKRGVQQAMMRPQSVYAYIPLNEQVANDFVVHIRKQKKPDGSLVDFRNDVAKWSLESSGMLVFEKRLNAFTSDAQSVIQKMIDSNAAMFHLAGLLKFSLPIFKYIPTPKWRRLVKAEDYFYIEVKKLIEETLAKLKSLADQGKTAGADQFNFIGYLLSKPELSEQDVYIVCLSLFGDGLNTTAPALIYNLYCLGANEFAQEKLYDEIKANVIGRGALTSDILQNMPYLKACVKEAFRLYPIGTEVSRVPQKNLVLSGYQIPAGTHLEINMGPQLINEKYFKNALQFSPERWLRDSKDATMHPFVLTPFGHGPRMCAGRRFAEQDLYIVITRLVQHFKIGYPGATMKQVMKTLLLPEDTTPFTFTDR